MCWFGLEAALKWPPGQALLGRCWGDEKLKQSRLVLLAQVFPADICSEWSELHLKILSPASSPGALWPLQIRF